MDEVEALILGGQPYEDAYNRMLDAQREFDMTPRGFSELEKDIADLRRVALDATVRGEHRLAALSSTIADDKEDRLLQGRTLRAARLAELKSIDRGDVEDTHESVTPEVVTGLLTELAYGNRPATEQELAMMSGLSSADSPPAAEHKVLWENLLQSDHPSHAVRAMMNSGLAEQWYPELHAIRDVPQGDDWHPEGPVGEHVAQAMDVAAQNASNNMLSSDDRRIVVLAALCHDFGKSSHTRIHDDGRISSQGHDLAGMRPTREFLNRLGADETLTAQVATLVKTHMRHVNPPTKNSARRLSVILEEVGLTLDHWAYVTDADTGGRGEASMQGVGDQWRAFL